MKYLSIGLSALLLFLSAYGIAISIKVLNIFYVFLLLFSIMVFIRHSICIFKYLKRK